VKFEEQTGIETIVEEIVRSDVRADDDKLDEFYKVLDKQRGSTVYSDCLWS
jgi:hypothetical protein